MVKLFLVVLILLLEDGHAEFLYCADDIPILVFFNVVADIIYNPLHEVAFLRELFYHLVDSFFLNLCIVERQLEVGVEIEFACHVAHDLLEEGIYGLYAEVGVVVEQVAEGFPGIFRDGLPFNVSAHTAVVFFYLFGVVFGVGQIVGKPIKLA